MKKQRVLFICSHNSARSQMAEGLLRSLYGEAYEVFSAGTEPTNLNPFAVQAMAERGIDISGSRAKSIEEFSGMSFDYVVTVCDQAKEACPFFPGGKTMLHKSFDDPGLFTGKKEDILDGFRRIRDEIEAWIKQTFGS